MKNLLSNFAFVAISVCAANASAATLNFDSTDGVTDSSGNLVSPYNGRLDGVAVKLFCDDFTHDINVPDVVSVNVSIISNLGLTRFGSLSDAISRYEQVFFLSSKFAGASNSDRADIQDAMWSYFSASAPNQSTSAVMGWEQLAKDNYAGKDYSTFRIFTDSTNQFSGKQELFTNMSTGPLVPSPAPEPGSWALLATGLGLLGFGTNRVRKQSQVSRG